MERLELTIERIKLLKHFHGHIRQFPLAMFEFLAFVAGDCDTVEGYDDYPEESKGLVDAYNEQIRRARELIRDMSPDDPSQ